MKRVTHRRKNTASNETGGFRFALTLLVALGTVFYTGYTYLQNTPVDPLWYEAICSLIPVAFILVVGLLLYILVKGYSMEVQDSKFLENLASYIYLLSFLIFVMFIVFVIGLFFLIFVLEKEFDAIVILFLMITPIMVGTVFFLPLLRKKRRKRILDIINVSLMMVLVFVAVLSLFLSLLPPVIYSPLQGKVTVDMEGVYYKTDTPIWILIHVTGPNTDLLIRLLHEESNHNLRYIDSIMLIPELNPSKTESGTVLVGNALDYGTYNVFINATDLTPGYYELRCVRPDYKKTCGVRGFYLVNSSQKPLNEELNAL